ncbi:MAG: hypothetical protein IH991_15875, partial [Planctomycetes bacterium]|nr:hypothetical protein [Planctomycetota bacterium]
HAGGAVSGGGCGEELTAKPTYTEVSVAGANIGLLVVDHVQPIHAPGALRLGVDELEATRQQIVTQGAHASEPELTPWGWRQFTVTDPDGHCWQIYDELMQTGESVCSSES